MGLIFHIVVLRIMEKEEGEGRNYLTESFIIQTTSYS